MNSETLNLGNGNIGHLIRKFSIPCVISMVVAALYNIVDQIYIGWSYAGAYGNAATNIVYPYTVLALGLALLVGDGSAAGFSLSLGEGNQKQADNSVGNGLCILVIMAIVLCAIGFIFRYDILQLFGAVFFASTFCRKLQSGNVGCCKAVLQVVAPTFCRLLQRTLPAG